VGQEVDGFLFVQVVASGPGSTVYRAMQRAVNDRLVAVKVLDAVEQRLLLSGQDDLNPLWRETRFSQTVRTPSIVRVFTTGRLPDGRYYVAMEFVEGPTLEEELRERGAFGEDEMLALVSQIAGAVGCLHQKRIVQRDIKPANLILRIVKDGPSRVKLIDFGQAKLAHHRDDWSSLGEQWVPGTPRYMAPEQARGEGTTPASDVYAVAAIAYELLTGKPVLALKRGNAETCLAYLRSERPLPTLPIRDVCPSVQPAVGEVIGRCLSRDPAARPEDADGLKAEVDALIQARPPPPVGSFRRVMRGLWSRSE